MEPVFGIDLGTTNSCVATIGDDGLPVIIRNLDDDNTTPSVVYYEDDGENYVGKQAKNSMGADSERTVAFIKREMSNDRYERYIDGKRINPVDVSALILKKVLDDANELRSYDGLPPVKKAVVTVPAYFGTKECELTKQAARIAGIEVLDLLNEPTAAALNYGVKGLEGKTFMIYDLGGGTFDVSIMRMKNGTLDTISTDGNHRLGGVDWDILLLDHALQKAGYDVIYDDIKDERDAGKMLLSAELCKKNLSRSERAILKLNYNRKASNIEITRSKFEDITGDLLEQTITIVRNAIKIAKEPNVKIDEIILVGGSSYMPMVRNRLTKEFSCPIRLDHLEPDLAVAKGAAIHAANIANASKDSKVKIGNDLGSRSYGILCTDENDKDYVSNIIKRTDNLIFEGTSSFVTRYEGQNAINVSVYENKSVNNRIDNVGSCTLIEKKMLSWGFPVPKGTRMTTHVLRSSDGTVKIWAECQGKRVDFEIKYKGAYTESEIQQKIQVLNNKTV